MITAAVPIALSREPRSVLAILGRQRVLQARSMSDHQYPSDPDAEYASLPGAAPAPGIS